MMHRKTAALLSLFSVLAFSILPSLAAAQDRGSEADQEACTPDVFRLCQDFIPNEGPIVTCLQAKRVQLSPACGRVMFPPDPAPQATPDKGPTPAQKRAVRKHVKKKHKHKVDG